MITENEVRIWQISILIGTRAFTARLPTLSPLVVAPIWCSTAQVAFWKLCALAFRLSAFSFRCLCFSSAIPLVSRHTMCMAINTILRTYMLCNWERHLCSGGGQLFVSPFLFFSFPPFPCFSLSLLRRLLRSFLGLCSVVRPVLTIALLLLHAKVMTLPCLHLPCAAHGVSGSHHHPQPPK